QGVFGQARKIGRQDRWSQLNHAVILGGNSSIHSFGALCAQTADDVRSTRNFWRRSPQAARRASRHRRQETGLPAYAEHFDAERRTISQGIQSNINMKARPLLLRALLAFVLAT